MKRMGTDGGDRINPLANSLDSLYEAIRAEDEEENKKKLFRVACDWQESGWMYIEAKTLEEAIKKAENSDDPLPDGDYIDGSFQVNREVSKYFCKEDHGEPECTCDGKLGNNDFYCPVHGKPEYNDEIK